MTRRSALIALLVVLAVLVALPSAVATALGMIPRLQVLHIRLAQASSFLHYGGLGWLVALGLGGAAWVLTRRRALLLVVVPALAGVLLHASWVAPYYYPNPQPARAPLGVTVLNVEFGNADGETLARRLAGSDVVALLEATPETITALTKAGMDNRFPHRVGRGAPGVAGTVVYSRLPLTDLGQGPTTLESRLVRVQTPGGPVLVAAVHPINPMSGPGPWAVDAALMHDWLRPHLGSDLIVGGDFNAIDRHITMKPFWDAGLRSTADITGAGFQRTWPMNRKFLPALIGIDHILVSPRLTAERHEVLRFDDTDHAGVRATVAFAR
ncbi:endonuclease/exonuclease/phosphatase family protein [Mariniluteicoccus flavus]